MELMNKDLLTLKINMTKDSISFKQDPALVAAINKLCSRNDAPSVPSLLPQRKLDFDEVQRLLKPAVVNKVDSEQITQQKGNENKVIIIRKIEGILKDIDNSAERGVSPRLVLRNQRLWSNCIYSLDRVTLKSMRNAKTTTLVYSNNEDKSRFNMIVFVLTKIHELLTKNITVTRRELFYQNVSRFVSQIKLDTAVRDACCLLETTPWSLGVVATAKGLIAGPIKMYNRDSSVLDCNVAGGTLIPQDIVGITKFETTAKYILLVEKDAIFQKLLDEGALIRLGPVILLTGKGYPDVCTRQLLYRLVSELRLRALALVDADPHGYEIYLTYKYGSLAQSHLSDSLACTSLLLLGARYQDLMTLVPTAARLALTALDRRKLAALINRPYLNTPTGDPIKEDLKRMLERGLKAELEAVVPYSVAMSDSYIPSKIIAADFLG
ncbi:meiotic recombination protein spo11 [Danaus plexippus plexippus]|uniref:DNA topoisomerase (ATP-hydrolyzing) n=1 Tax=Danaus plexippus plexippus TaxID=278856 RepID=A0A212F620_DANPL|nr:meiotic recombination protein spo11 [Danaus plexippus plexippus]